MGNRFSESFSLDLIFYKNIMGIFVKSPWSHHTKQALFVRNQLWDSISPDALSIIYQITHHAFQKVLSATGWYHSDKLICVLLGSLLNASIKITNSVKDPQTNPCLKIFHVLCISLQIFQEETCPDIKQHSTCSKWKIPVNTFFI